MTSSRMRCTICSGVSAARRPRRPRAQRLGVQRHQRIEHGLLFGLGLRDQRHAARRRCSSPAAAPPGAGGSADGRAAAGSTAGRRRRASARRRLGLLAEAHHRLGQHLDQVAVTKRRTGAGACTGAIWSASRCERICSSTSRRSARCRPAVGRLALPLQLLGEEGRRCETSARRNGVASPDLRARDLLGRARRRRRTGAAGACRPPRGTVRPRRCGSSAARPGAWASQHGAVLQKATRSGRHLRPRGTARTGAGNWVSAWMAANRHDSNAATRPSGTRAPPGHAGHGASSPAARWPAARRAPARARPHGRWCC